MSKLYGNPYFPANRLREVLEAMGTAYEEEEIVLSHDDRSSARFPAVKYYLKMHLPQASAKKAFAADIIQPYLG